jgi:hypothetical protein
VYHGTHEGRHFSSCRNYELPSIHLRPSLLYVQWRYIRVWQNCEFKPLSYVARANWRHLSSRHQRQDIIKTVSPEFTALIWGSTDTEHLAALYMTELCRTTGRTENGPDEDYQVEDMWRALKWAIHKVEEIQRDHGITEPNNVFNVCAGMCPSLLSSHCPNDRFSRWELLSCTLLPHRTRREGPPLDGHPALGNR